MPASRELGWTPPAFHESKTTLSLGQRQHRHVNVHTLPVVFVARTLTVQGNKLNGKGTQAATAESCAAVMAVEIIIVVQSWKR